MTKNNTDLSGVLIKLLQGFIYREEQHYWDALIFRQDVVRDYVRSLGLVLHLDDTDGYAFLKSNSVNEEDESDSEESASNLVVENIEPKTLRLMRKIPLSYEVSLLCVLLREALEFYDEKVSDDHRLIISRSEIYDMLREFSSKTTDEVKQNKRFDALISKVQEFGFLRELRNDSQRFEVRRPIKALVDAQKLLEIKQQMQRHLGLSHEV